MFWSINQLNTPKFEYTDIVISKNDLIRNVEILDARWPETHIGEMARSKVGRPREYDYEEFWRLVCWHLQEYGILENQGEFVKQMGPILDIAWQNLDQQPADTWLKERARELFETREIYKQVINELTPQE